MKRLQLHLDENAKINPKSHYTLPSMRVKLKVGPDCKIEEKPRKFYAHTEQEEVEKTIKKWLEDGVIVPVK